MAITPVPEDRVPIVAAMTARAFLDEPLLRWPLGDVPDPLVAIEEEFMFVLSVAAACGCLWEAGDAIPELSFTAMNEVRAVGHVTASRATVATDRVVAVGPIGVLPDHQGTGSEAR